MGLTRAPTSSPTFSPTAYREPLVDIKTAANSVVISQTSITSVPACAITGDIGVSPIASGAMPGFSFNRWSPLYLTSTQIVGKGFAVDCAAPTLAAMPTAVSNMNAAYRYAKARQRPASFSLKYNMNAGQLGGDYGGECDQFKPGVYTFGTPVSINSDLYFLVGSGEASGQGNLDLFIIQITGTLSLTAKTQVILQNDALAKNTIWQVPGAITIGAHSHIEGIILGETTIDMITSSTLIGRMFAQTAVNLGMGTFKHSLGHRQGVYGSCFPSSDYQQDICTLAICCYTYCSDI